ncbi:MAG: TIGR00304 family protein [Thermofilum sp. ex4484_79]|nr:MAG: TIGR00304 family protein [Thermofilum sp. ex4484_79]
MSAEIGIVLIFIGMLLVIAGVLIAVIISLRREGATKEENVKAAGVFFIGPIPIVVASDKESAKIALYFTILGLIFFIIIMILALL